VAGAQELRQRRTEIRAGQAVQVQQWEHLGHPRRLARPRGQDRRSEPFRSPVAGSVRLPLTRGARTGTGPAAVIISRSL
jgi:hypothetical protein